MAKRLAITIAGAVSLGSYEAGVLYEVLDALHQHNNAPQTAAGSEIKIDVLTGASAGGMTAAILAQKLLYSADEFHGPYDNPLYKIWVAGIDLKDLLQPKPDEPALHSLLSSDLIEAISAAALTSRYAAGSPPPPVGHAAVGAELRLGLALTNLNGVDYAYAVEPGGNGEPIGRFLYRDYVDQITRTIDGSSDNKDFWDPIRQAAVACGAFPIAFRPQDLQRSAKAEPDDYPPENLVSWKHDPTPFTYTDGGVLQNQPIGIAKNLVDAIDNHHDQEGRYYLFVSPNAKDDAPNPSFSAANADYPRMVARLLKVVIGQAGFHDWITAEAVNHRIALLDERAGELKDAIRRGDIPVAPFQATATALLQLLFPGGAHTPPGATGPEQLPDAQDRIARQYASEMGELGAGTPVAAAFRDGVLVLESAAGLGARDKMRIYGVTATDAELAGAGLQAFVGFFDWKFRDHDYDVGRLHARAVLSNPALSADGEIGPIHFDAQRADIRPVDARLNGIKLADLPVADLQEFKQGMRQRINGMLVELIPTWVGSEAAKLVLDPLLELALDRLIHTA
jgi:hypothetical protein